LILRPDKDVDVHARTRFVDNAVHASLCEIRKQLQAADPHGGGHSIEVAVSDRNDPVYFERHAWKSPVIGVGWISDAAISCLRSQSSAFDPLDTANDIAGRGKKRLPVRRAQFFLLIVVDVSEKMRLYLVGRAPKQVTDT